MNFIRRCPIFPFGLIILFCTHCNLSEIPNLDNTYLPNYEGRVAFIVGKDTLTVGDFIRELSDDTTIVQEEENRNLYFMYEKSTQFSLGGDFVDISTFSNNKTIQSPIGIPFIPPIDTTIEIEQLVNFNFLASKGERVDSVFYNNGKLQLDFTSDFPAEVSYKISTNSFLNTSTQAHIELSDTLNYAGSTPVFGQQTIKLSGYKTILNNQSDSSIFQINILARVKVVSGTALTGNESINVKMDVVDPEFDAIYGSFGKDTFDINSQEISFDIFSEFSNSGLSFEAPIISFEFQNSFGIPTGLSFGNIYAGYDDQPDQPLTGSFVESLQIIAAPSIQNAGSYAISTLEMSNNNSNIGALLSSSPDRLTLDLTGVTNPGGETSNFLLSNSDLILKSTIKLPLSIQLNQFEYTSEFDLGDISQLENGEEIFVQLKTVNELPFDGALDLIFVDENQIDLDSILDIQILRSPQDFDSEGKVSVASTNTATIELNKQKIDALVNASKLRIVTRINSYGYQQNEFVKIFSDYSLITTVSVEGKVSINLNE